MEPLVDPFTTSRGMHCGIFLIAACHSLQKFRRTVVSIPCGPSALAVKEAAWGLARYAAISQVRLFFPWSSFQ